MGRAIPLTAEAVARIREMAAAGASRAAIARELGCSPTTVRRYVGPDHDFAGRPQMASAVAAKQLDNRERRAQQIGRMLDLTDRILSRLEADTYTHRIKVADASYVVTDKQLDSEDERNHVQSLTSLTTTVARLEAIDTDAGASSARSLLHQLGEALGVSGPST